MAPILDWGFWVALAPLLVGSWAIFAAMIWMDRRSGGRREIERRKAVTPGDLPLPAMAKAEVIPTLPPVERTVLGETRRAD